MHVSISHDEKSNIYVSFHEGKNPFKCVNCKSKFKRDSKFDERNDMKIHIVSVHNEKSQMKCMLA